MVFRSREAMQELAHQQGGRFENDKRRRDIPGAFYRVLLQGGLGRLAEILALQLQREYLHGLTHDV